MTNCQIIVKSFRRFDALERFVQSVRSFYPVIDILIADDSFDVIPLHPPEIVKRIQRMPNVKWIAMAFDSGLSAGRNRLVRDSTAPILILCDDDFVFTSETCLEKLLSVVGQVDVAGGLIREEGKMLGSPGRFQFTDAPERSLEVLPVETPWREINGVPYRMVEMVLNFFAARRDTLQRFPWDDRFRITGEHLDFFLSLRAAGARVAYTPEVIVDHLVSGSPDYFQFRCREAEFRPLIARKWGVARVPRYQPYIEVVP